MIRLGVGVAFSLLMMGCAVSPETQQSIDTAQQQLDALPVQYADAALQLDYERARETLDRASRFAQYTGGEADARHYAALSQRYSRITALHKALHDAQAQRAPLQAALSRSQQVSRVLKRYLSETPADVSESMQAWSEEALQGQDSIATLYFSLNRYQFNDESNEDSVVAIADMLHQQPNAYVQVNGYSDARGDADSKRILAEQRAQYVALWLQDLGVAEDRIQWHGYSDQQPIAANSTEHGRALNRRVEVFLTQENALH